MNNHLGKSKKAKVEFVARITDADGQVVEKVVSASGGFPSSDDFDLSTKEGFLADFDALEKAVLEARNKAASEISEEYLGLISKKNKLKGILILEDRPPQNPK